MDGVRVFEQPPPEAERLDLPDFLAWLGAPAIFHLKGKVSDCCRVLMGGLHGNEPSGFYAVHSLLRDPPPLATDTVLLLGNVRAAIGQPPFQQRFLPDEEDMNRVWRLPLITEQRRVAQRILDYLLTLRIEAAADLHNNTGYNPIYSVMLSRGPRWVSLARNWTSRFVLYEGTSLGTFLEALDPVTPGIVIECGQAGDPEADRAALAGARRFLSTEDPFALHSSEGEDELYRSLARVTIPTELSVAFAGGPTEADLTVYPKLDRFNFKILPQGSRLAYRSERGRLVMLDNAGRDVTDDYFLHRDGEIFLSRSVVPVMMTTSASAAKGDCLLYVAERL